MDNGISNLVTRIAKSGSEYERAQLAVARNSATALNVTQQVSSEGDLDFTKAVTDMKMLDYAYLWYACSDGGNEETVHVDDYYTNIYDVLVKVK